ncbi:LacI family DNA-binding transcriptional regulator [Metabacillus sp. GX 13764]|uniref:LacI family DNA-binding transcriptional regulator n=1 Tax=Metabacillus kandeliae TaxID=2900151 RepID=UPI001E386C81|nr:LacI family DNA-binding transcriptional regulator [Metabacillus kandeliae]MCD7033586.1 LacI family DNA-binding transcriptional regulator [Metabacillus kandeliae]
MATIKDIALKAQVSIATVSRILSGNKTYSFSNETVLKVKEAAAELDYFSRKKLRPLKQAGAAKEAFSISIVYWFKEEQEHEFLYYREIRSGIEKRFISKNIPFRHYYTVEKFQKNKNKNTDGIIAVGKFSTQEIQVLQENSSNIIFVDSSPDPLLFDSVTADFFAAMKDLIEYCIEKGHRKIGYIGKKEYVGDGQAYPDIKEESYQLIMKSKELYDPSFHLVIDDPTPSAGFEIANHSLNKKMPDAFIVFSDTVSLGVLSAFQEASLKVPDDISIISFDDLPIARYTYPSLSTVKIFTEQMGMAAADILCERISQNIEIPRKIVIPHKVIIRNSSR